MSRPNGLVKDVDIYAANALKICFTIFAKHQVHLWSRIATPRSHWVYRVPDAETHKQFNSNEMILEVRGNKRCTVFPGSVHPSGEPIEFEDRGNFEPQRIDMERTCMGPAAKIAISNELFVAWKPGQRHDMALATAAKLARVGWSRENVRYLISAIALEANDEEVADRLLAVDTTFEFLRLRRTNHRRGTSRRASRTGKTGEYPEMGFAPKFVCQEHKRSPSHENVGSIWSFSNHLTSDAGAADAFAANFKDELVWCGGNEWYLRKKEVFEPVCFEIVQGLAKEFLQGQLGGINQAPLMLSPLRCLGRTRINASVELSKAKFFLEPAQLDAKRDLAGCLDGSVLRLAPENTDTDSVFVTKS